MPQKATKQNTNQKTAPIQKKSFYCWVYSSKKIQLCSFQLSWKIPFLLQHSNRIYWMWSVQSPWTTKTKHESKTAPIQKNSFYCWVYSSKKIQLCSFQLSWKIPFVLWHSNHMYWMLSVQPPWTTRTKHKSKNCFDSKEQLLLLSLFQ